MQRDWLKKIVETAGLGIMERRDLISKDDRLSLPTQCDLLGISKSDLYYLPKGESVENLEMMKKMDKYHHDHATYGVLQMQDYLFALGFLPHPPSFVAARG
jgi:putative transposase